MQNLQITCDSCSQDLTSTSNCENYRLALKAESIPVKEGWVTAMAIYPPVDRDYHFCGMNCLKNWMQQKFT